MNRSILIADRGCVDGGIGTRTLDKPARTTKFIHMATSTNTTEVWQARIGRGFAEQLQQDATVLGLDGRTDIVKAALQLLHRRAAEERMAGNVETFYAGTTPPLPIGVLPDDEDEPDPDEVAGASGPA